MSTTVSPTLNEFLETANRAFDYLCSDYGFIRDKVGLNPYAIVFAKKEIGVCVEGINWGFGTNVLLSCGNQCVPLWAIAQARGSSVPPISGQLAQLEQHAILLRELAVDVLKGDTSIFPLALDAMDKAAMEASLVKVHRLP